MVFTGGHHGNLGTRAWGSLGPLAIFLRRGLGAEGEAAETSKAKPSRLKGHGSNALLRSVEPSQIPGKTSGHLCGGRAWVIELDHDSTDRSNHRRRRIHDRSVGAPDVDDSRGRRADQKRWGMAYSYAVGRPRSAR